MQFVGVSELGKQTYGLLIRVFACLDQRSIAHKLSAIYFAVFMSACSSADDDRAVEISDSSATSVIAGITTSPVDVMAEFVRVTGKSSERTTESNLFTNAGFENGADGWFVCDETGKSAEVVSGNSYEGIYAMEVSSGSCFYRSVPVTPGTELLLSCFAQVVGANEWTGMGLGFSDSNWNKLEDAPSAIIGGKSYSRYDVKGIAPPGTSYASMWFYSETPALVDACLLTEPSIDNEPESPIFTGENLLDNANFDDVTGVLPDNWQRYCNDGAEVLGNGDVNELLVYDGTCVAQALSAGKIAALRGQPFELSCEIQSSSIDGSPEPYASLAIALDGNEQVVVIPNNSSQQVRLTNTAPADISSGYVSIYNEGEPDTLRVTRCNLKILKDIVTPNFPDNLLVNGSFDELDANNKPKGWEKGCGGTWESLDLPLAGTVLNLKYDAASPHPSNSSCISQTLTAEAVAALQGKYYKLECIAWNQTGPTTASLFENLNNNRIQLRNIPQGTAWQSYSLEGVISNGVGAPPTIKIFGSNDLLINDCSLIALEPDQVPPVTAAIDVRVNLEGDDVYRLMGPYTFENYITNTGDVRLTNIQNETIRNGEVICRGTLPSLDPGETNRTFCPSDIVVSSIAVPPVSVNLVVTAESYDGTLVQDSDTAGYALSRRPNAQAVLFIEADKPTVAVGETAVFTVSVGSTGNYTGVSEVTSSETTCAKTYADRPDGVLKTGEFDVYKCSLPNVQSDQTVSVELQISGDGLAVLDFETSDSATVTVE